MGQTCRHARLSLNVLIYLTAVHMDIMITMSPSYGASNSLNMYVFACLIRLFSNAKARGVSSLTLNLIAY